MRFRRCPECRTRRTVIFRVREPKPDSDLIPYGVHRALYCPLCDHPKSKFRSKIGFNVDPEKSQLSSNKLDWSTF